MVDRKYKGFTLIELLIVIAIVAILAGVVLIAVNPGRQMAQARNAERSAEVNAILNAVSQYQVDNGSLPTCVSTSTTCIGTGGACCDLTSDLTPGYIAEIPIGPGAACAASDICYDIAKTNTTPARVTVSAPGSELGVTISYTR